MTASSTTPALFPIVPSHRDIERPAPPPPELVTDRAGVARLTACSPLADAKRGAEYYLLPARTLLNRCNSDRVPFEWTVNPYRGCEFGCGYCYARYTHEYMELAPEEFERKIFVKDGAGRLAARELISRLSPGQHIAIGTATDPYQPAEREFGVTRAILTQMAQHEGLRVSITTKSDQVTRDLELLRRIAARSSLTVNVTVTTLRARLARLLEPRAPHPDLRIGAVHRLREAGIAAGVFAMPVLPGITDSEEDLEDVARAARRAGACWFGASVLFLMRSSRKRFLPLLEKQFPSLARHYHRWYGQAGCAPETYRHAIRDRVAALRGKYGLAALAPGERAVAPPAQQLFLALTPDKDRPQVVRKS